MYKHVMMKQEYLPEGNGSSRKRYRINRRAVILLVEYPRT